MDRSLIEAVKSRTDIVEVVRRYVDLRPVSGRWMGPCPFHNETKPSFSVNGEEGFFYCFGCQAAGDVINFHMRVNGLEFADSLRQLAREAGIDLGNFAPDPDAERRKGEKKAMLEMHELAQRHFLENLAQGPGRVARNYLKKRGLSSEVIETFGLGYGLDQWNALENYLKSKGYTPEQAAVAGLLSKNEKGNIYDRFRGRLMFPIQNLAGKVIAFGGRILDKDEAKYINSSDSPIYKKGEHLYGLAQARSVLTRTRRVALTEGYMDVISLHQFGYRHSCGVLGTALTPEQVRRLSGFVSHVDLVFDGDEAGRKAAFKSAEMILAQGLKASVVLLPEGEDVDSLLQARGPSGFDAFLERAEGGFDYLVAAAGDMAPKDMLAWARNFLGKFPDPSLRAYYIPRLASGLGLAESELRATMAGTRPSGPRFTDPPAPAPGALDSDEKRDRSLLGFVVRYPEYLSRVLDTGMDRVLATREAARLLEKLAEYADGDVLPWLDEEERAFWCRCRQQELHEGEDPEEEWNFIRSQIDKGKRKLDRKDLMRRMVQAQEAGDIQKANELGLALLSLRRDDEQHQGNPAD